MGIHWGDLGRNPEGPGSAPCKVSFSCSTLWTGCVGWLVMRDWERQKGAGQCTGCFLCGEGSNWITEKDGLCVTVALSNAAISLGLQSDCVFWKKAHQLWPAAALSFIKDRPETTWKWQSVPRWTLVLILRVSWLTLGPSCNFTLRKQVAPLSHLNFCCGISTEILADTSQENSWKIPYTDTLEFRSTLEWFSLYWIPTVHWVLC